MSEILAGKYPTYVPSSTDSADIKQAFSYFLYGTSVDVQNPSNGLAKYISDLYTKTEGTTAAILAPATLGSGVSLNDYIISGYYHQPSTTNARSNGSANYPLYDAGVAAATGLAYSGFLTISGSITDGFIYQQYRISDSATPTAPGGVLTNINANFWRIGRFNGGSNITPTVSSATTSSGVFTYSYGQTYGTAPIKVGQIVTISGMSPSGYNVTATVTGATTSNFTLTSTAISGNPDSTVGGTATVSANYVASNYVWSNWKQTLEFDRKTAAADSKIAIPFLDSIYTRTSIADAALGLKQDALATPGYAVVTGPNATNGKYQMVTSAVTSTELGYLSGATSSIQTQINAKAVVSATGSSVRQNIGATVNSRTATAVAPFYNDAKVFIADPTTVGATGTSMATATGITPNINDLWFW
jgi:hypothetical protein